MEFEMSDSNNEPMITYRHKDGDNETRFRQYAKDPIPVWAVDVQPEQIPEKPQTTQKHEFVWDGEDYYCELCNQSIASVDEYSFCSALDKSARHFIPTGWRLVPEEPTEDMVNAALQSTSGYLNIPGSQLTVNREKARIRYKAMLAKAPQCT